MTSGGRALLAYAFCALSTASSAQAPLTPPRDNAARPLAGTATIRGQVIRADSGEPLRGADVSLTPTDMRDILRIGPDGRSEPASLPEAITDASGRFELQAVPAGRYLLTASKSGFVRTQYGQRRPYQSGQPVQIATGAVVEQMDVALMRGAAIGGRVLDENGETLAGATVRVVRQRFVGGRPELAGVGAIADHTDDLGEFRLFGLPPGAYFVEASLTRSGEPGPFARVIGSPEAGSFATFYPSALSPADAAPVQVGTGEERLDLVVVMRRPVTSTLRVIVHTADGQAASNVSVRAYAALRGGGTGSLPTERRGDGAYVAANLPPGSYAIEAEGADGTIARAQVRLDGGDIDLPLTLTRGATLRGRVSFGSQRAPASVAPQSIRVVLRAASRDDAWMQDGTVVRNDWTFEIGRLAGRARLDVVPPDGWTVRSIRSGDADVTDAVLDFSSDREISVDMNLTNRVTEVSGTVRDARGQGASDAAIVLFAEDQSRWGYPSRFVTLVRPNQAGLFSRRGLPPGQYLAVALDFLEDGDETNPELLAQLQSAATRVTLVEGETTPIDLPMTRR